MELLGRVSKATLEIVGYQNTSLPVIPRASFERLVAAIVRSMDPELRIQSTAIDALLLATETYTTTFLAGIIPFYLSLELIT
jgi:histone H3/H4